MWSENLPMNLKLTYSNIWNKQENTKQMHWIDHVFKGWNQGREFEYIY